MTRNLRKAVSKEDQGFELYFQPIMLCGTEENFAAEALLRYRDAEGTLHSNHTVLLINWRKAV